MTAVTRGRDEAAPPGTASLTGRELSRLRAASAWARFLGIVGFVAAVLTAVALLGLSAFDIARGSGNGSLNAFPLPLLLTLISVGSAAWLLWGFGRNVQSFVQRGESTTLARAFRKLRQFFKLWTFVVVLSTLLKVLSLYGKL